MVPFISSRDNAFRIAASLPKSKKSIFENAQPLWWPYILETSLLSIDCTCIFYAIFVTS